MTKKVSDVELRFLAQSDWSRTNAAPLAQELIVLRSEVLRLTVLLDEVRTERSELEAALLFARSSRGA